LISIDLGGLRVAVVHKEIKNLHLSVLPPEGRVRIAAPSHMKLDTIRVFVISRLAWIKAQQHKMRAQRRETPRQYLDRESHYVWGRRCLLKKLERDARPAVKLERNRLVMQVRPAAEEAACRRLLDAWYRAQLREALPALLTKWEVSMRVCAGPVFVQQMKTKWGSCNPATRAIRLNTDLAKKPPECLEYIVVHEMTHLLEPTHNARFIELMNLKT
jgi:predicted metal-dependent hydrolase